MTRLSSLILLSATALVLASPALAKVSVQSAEKMCKDAISKQEPAPKSVKVDKESTRATGGSFTYLFKVKGADDATVKLNCTVDRSTETVSGITPAN
jgi:hypothetical protein